MVDRDIFDLALKAGFDFSHEVETGDIYYDGPESALIKFKELCIEEYKKSENAKDAYTRSVLDRQL